MKPIDFRNTTWEHVQEQVTDLRKDVYRALTAHGPCTTRRLAERSGIDILSVRPRVTELYQLGLAELANPEAGGGEGIYQAVPWVVAKDRFEKQRAAALNPQQMLL